MKKEDIKKMDQGEIAAEIKKAERELLEISLRMNMSQEKDTSKKNKQRKLIARLKTILTEKSRV